MKITHQQGDPRGLTLLDENARFMRHEVFQRLVANIRKDGVLLQWPFVWHDEENDRRVVLSGNHRVKASIEAGLPVIDWTECDEYLTEDQRLEIQLGTNAITGEDDPTILRRLYESIQSVDSRLASGLDDEGLGLLERLETESLSEVNLDFWTMAIVFLPHEFERAMEAFAEAKRLVGTAKFTGIAADDQYERIADALEDARSAANIGNMATALGLILDVFEEHRTDMRKHWMDTETVTLTQPKSAGIPITSLFGYEITAEEGQFVERAIRKTGGGGGQERGRVLVKWAAKVLGEDAPSSEPVDGAPGKAKGKPKAKAAPSPKE